jgi:hypothetical protein
MFEAGKVRGNAACQTLDTDAKGAFADARRSVDASVGERTQARTSPAVGASLRETDWSLGGLVSVLA